LALNLGGFGLRGLGLEGLGLLGSGLSGIGQMRAWNPNSGGQADLVSEWKLRLPSVSRLKFNANLNSAIRAAKLDPS